MTTNTVSCAWLGRGKSKVTLAFRLAWSLAAKRPTFFQISPCITTNFLAVWTAAVRFTAANIDNPDQFDLPSQIFDNLPSSVYPRYNPVYCYQLDLPSHQIGLSIGFTATVRFTVATIRFTVTPVRFTITVRFTVAAIRFTVTPVRFTAVTVRFTVAAIRFTVTPVDLNNWINHYSSIYRRSNSIYRHNVISSIYRHSNWIKFTITVR